MDEVKKIETPDPVETAFAPRVLRELLRTPAVKEMLAISLKDSNPEIARELVKAMLWSDSVFSFGMLGQLPRGLNFLVAFLDELGRQLQNLPPHLLREFAFEMARSLDTESLRALPRAYAPLLTTLAGEDTATRQRLLDKAAETLNGLLGLSARTVDSLARDGSPPEGDALEGKGIDPVVLGHLITSLFEWLGRSAGKDPEMIRLSQERKSRFFEETIRAADFGKIRSAITRQAKVNHPVTESVVTAIVSDPVIFANLINILPPLLNNLLKGTANALARIDFPPEILASAVFNLLGDLEAEELGEIVNNLSRLINNLHEGSAVLGREEPRFRPVLQSFLEKALQSVDETQAARALLALGEDLEVVLCVAADTAAEKPELLEKMFSALLLGFNANLRGFTYLLEQLNELPPHLYSHVAQELDKKDFNEIGKLINNLLKLTNRILAENPFLVENALATLYRSFDQGELRSLGRTALQQGAAFAANENLLQLFPPEETGKALNACLTSYNQKLAREPDQVGELLGLYLSHLNPEELSRALLLTSGQLSQTLSENPQLSKSVIKSFFTVLRGAIKGSLRRKRKSQVSHAPESRSMQGRGE